LPGKSVRGTDLSAERAEHKRRAAGKRLRNIDRRDGACIRGRSPKLAALA
jgi:hypothetical protein